MEPELDTGQEGRLFFCIPPDGGTVNLCKLLDHVLLLSLPPLPLPGDSAAGVSSRRYVEFIKAIPFIILLMLVACVLSV